MWLEASKYDFEVFFMNVKVPQVVAALRHWLARGQVECWGGRSGTTAPVFRVVRKDTWQDFAAMKMTQAQCGIRWRDTRGTVGVVRRLAASQDYLTIPGVALSRCLMLDCFMPLNVLGKARYQRSGLMIGSPWGGRDAGCGPRRAKIPLGE